MSNLTQELAKAQQEYETARDHLDDVRERYATGVAEPKMQESVGKWFKIQNRYSTPDSPWWMYLKIVGIRDRGRTVRPPDVGRAVEGSETQREIATCKLLGVEP